MFPRRAGRFHFADPGVKDVPNVTEDLPLEPLTGYSKYKALCEDVLTAGKRKRPSRRL